MNESEPKPVVYGLTADASEVKEALERAVAGIRRVRALRPHALRGKKPPLTHHSERVGRNDPCPCGSGVKFKRCCYLSARP